MATAYCTDRELKDVYPHVDDFDSKVPIYGWVQETSLDNFSAVSGLNIWYSYNTGLVTQLYQDGVPFTSLTSNLTTAATAMDGIITDTATTFDVDAGHGIDTLNILKIKGANINEYVKVTGVSTNTITIVRNLFNTQAGIGVADDSVYIAVDHNFYDQADYKWFFYDADRDLLVAPFAGDSNPNDTLMEAGEDWSTLKTRYRENASRYLESKIDKKLPREQFKDKDGNYDYVIVRTTALLAAAFLIRSHDPTSEVAASLWEEANTEIEKLNSGENTLSWMTTADGSKGIVREITGTGNIRIVDTRGRYGGTYDRIGVKITTGGVIGTAKYSVWVKDSDYLGAERMNNGATANISAETINGQFQSLTGGLQIRFGGDTADAANVNDKWEVEVSGYYEEVDNASSMRSVRMTRK